MQIGTISVFQKAGYGDDVSDSQVCREDLNLALLAEPLGFDSVWCVEHHFEDYAFCPDNTVFLSHIAAKTERIKLATGAVILPWNDPLRVAEKVALLDELSDGRVIFGMGRGLAQREYDQFGIEMSSSRERFDEASQMILKALETGVIEGKGKYYSQPPARIRPRPSRTFVGRTTAVAGSPESQEQAAKLGVQIMMFIQKPIEAHAEEIEIYRSAYREHHGNAPPSPTLTSFCICHEDSERAEELAEAHITEYLFTVMQHYELMGEHFEKAKGYDTYASSAVMMREIGLEAVQQGYKEAQMYGTPDEIMEKAAHYKDVIGDFNGIFSFRFAGLPYSEAEASMKLFAEKAMPRLRQLSA